MGALFKESSAIGSPGQPGWCSDGLWDSVAGGMDQGRRRVKVKFSRAERKIFRKRKSIKVSQWVEKHRVLTMSALPGIWRNEVTPYLVGIMDAAALPFVHEINVCATPQTGKTESAHNFVGYCIDRAPGPVMYIYPDETTGKENMDDRIIPMIMSSPRLRTHLTGKDRDKSSLRVRLQHMPIYIAWARSASRLANKPIRYAIADEIDKDGFSPMSSKEARPLDLIDKRFNTYRSVYKFFKISTPTLEEGNIWQALQLSDVIFEYHAKCPLCGVRQLMTVEGIKWEGGSSADRQAIKSKHLAWYECENCGGHWDDDLRNEAVRGGLWMVKGEKLTMEAYLSRFRPSSIGFQVPAWISYFVSLSECAAAFLKGIEEGPLAMQDFDNAFRAEPYRPRIANQEESEILAHRIDLPSGVVPRDAVALTCGIDVQKLGFWFLIKAWKRDLSSHRMLYGWVTTWDDITDLIYNTRYPVEGSKDKTMAIWRAAIDTGGGPEGMEDEWSKTEEIYEWIRKNGRGTVFGIKGASRPQVKKVNPRVIDRMKRKNRVIPGGITLYFLDTAALKEAFWWRMGRRFKKTDDGPPETQHITMHADMGMDYVRQILAEEKQRDRRTGKIKWVPIRKDNHLLDCEIYSDACADPEWMPSLSGMIRRKKRKFNGKKGRGSGGGGGFVNSWR